ncbi:MAG: ATP-binding cassette domain-containing protein [Clostridia bacterium]|nr:ATP-binding cassette domain-containing protein [Clostridia bacterium]
MNIEIRNIQKSFGKKEVLRDVSFSCTGGKIVGILGGNGSGKSTLFGVLTGLIRADAGAFTIDGFPVVGKRRREMVGLVPQKPPLFEELTAKDNLLLWYDREQMERELDGGILNMLGIDAFLKVPVSKMSGGMKKRLAIGCAVAHRPPILLLDEPCAALDLICKERIANYLIEYRNEGHCVLLATHDVNEISLCDELYILKDGTVTPFEYDGNIHKLVGRL